MLKSLGYDLQVQIAGRCSVSISRLFCLRCVCGLLCLSGVSSFRSGLGFVSSAAAACKQGCYHCYADKRC